MRQLDQVLYEVKEGIAYVTLNYEERLNALSQGIRKGLRSAMDLVEQDKQVRIIILTGAGRAFCAGGDISGFQQIKTMVDVENFSRDVISLFHRMEKLPKPIIAAVNGLALGGGLELCVASDIVIASDKAKFGVPEPKIGLVPGFAIGRLSDLLGRNKASYLMMTADPISAEEAEKIGLISLVVSHDQLMEKTVEVAKKVMENAPLAVSLLKTAANRELGGDDLVFCIEATCKLFATQDQKEGMDAFLNKRKPNFKGY
jgi:enoyl-CoA hydratase/carnithine racemase